MQLTINERFTKAIKELYHSHGQIITKPAFYEKIGISSTIISHIKRNRQVPTVQTLQKLVDFEPKLNLHWLITGTGQMMNSDESISSLTTNEAENKYIALLALVDFHQDRIDGIEAELSVLEDRNGSFLLHRVNRKKK